MMMRVRMAAQDQPSEGVLGGRRLRLHNMCAMMFLRSVSGAEPSSDLEISTLHTKVLSRASVQAARRGAVQGGLQRPSQSPRGLQKLCRRLQSGNMTLTPTLAVSLISAGGKIFE